LPEETPERTRVDKLLADLRARNAEHPRDLSFVASALDRADKLLAAGNGAEARAIASSVIALYGDDERAAADVARAKHLLEATKGIAAGSAVKQGAAPTKQTPVQSAPSGSAAPGAAAKPAADKMGP